MFKLTQDFNENGVELKKGLYSEEELIKLYGSKEKFIFCFKCTNLSKVLVETLEEVESKQELVETLEENNQIIYLAKEDIKKGKKVIVKKDDRITSEELEKIFGDDIINILDKLIETKITNVSV